MHGQGGVESSKNEGMVLLLRHPGGETERKETRKKHRFQSTAGAVAFGAKANVRSMRVTVVMWCLLWINEVKRVMGGLGVTRVVSGRGEGWYPRGYIGEWSGGRKEVGQGNLFQFSPRFLQLDLRWAWDPGVSAGVLWVYVGLMVRTAWIRRSRGVKEKCGMLEVQGDRKRWIVLTSRFCDPCNGARDQPGFKPVCYRWIWRGE